MGSAAVLAAATQGPISSLVFLLELTSRSNATIVPILIAGVSATLVTRMFESRSIYSIDIEQSGEQSALRAYPLITQSPKIHI